MDFELNEEERLIQKLARDFAEKEIRPVAHLYDESEEVPYEIIGKASRLGLASAFSSGRAEVDSPLAPALVTEQLSWGCAGIALAIASSGLAQAAIAATGTPEQKERFLPLCTSADGSVRLGAMGLTEAEAGSDVANLQTTAVRDGDEWVLNGTKRWTTNGGIADVHVIFATEDKSKGWDGLSAFAVPRGAAGLSMGTKWKKMGIRASHTADVILEDCRIPADHKLGYDPSAQDGAPRGPGAPGAITMLERTRPVVGAFALGIAQAAFDKALEYTKTRVQFGKPIAMNQAIAFKLAEMHTEIEAARMLVYKGCWLAMSGQPMWRAEGSQAKYFASDVAMKVTIDALQLHGGVGYMREEPLEKWVRDAKIFQIFEGTNEIQRLVISRALIGRLERESAGSRA
ncbi:MAG: acyl-CoA dehydrogenase [Dehalococcoidia bacterium]|nr:acyl-CoA dehydrogenase [Dehalococcoidia bacterium]